VQALTAGPPAESPTDAIPKGSTRSASTDSTDSPVIISPTTGFPSLSESIADMCTEGPSEIVSDVLEQKPNLSAKGALEITSQSLAEALGERQAITATGPVSRNRGINVLVQLLADLRWQVFEGLCEAFAIALALLLASLVDAGTGLVNRVNDLLVDALAVSGDRYIGLADSRPSLHAMPPGLAAALGLHGEERF
jgi:hypothetical protein